MGTLTAVGPASITVQTSSGAATYPIESSTLLIKDGQRVSSPSALKVGDTVVVHVYPQNGSTHTEMVIDGVTPAAAASAADADDGTRRHKRVVRRCGGYSQPQRRPQVTVKAEIDARSSAARTLSCAAAAAACLEPTAY